MWTSPVPLAFSIALVLLGSVTVFIICLSIFWNVENHSLLLHTWWILPLSGIHESSTYNLMQLEMLCDFSLVSFQHFSCSFLYCSHSSSLCDLFSCKYSKLCFWIYRWHFSLISVPFVTCSASLQVSFSSCVYSIISFCTLLTVFFLLLSS